MQKFSLFAGKKCPNSNKSQKWNERKETRNYLTRKYQHKLNNEVWKTIVGVLKLGCPHVLNWIKTFDLNSIY